MPFPKAEAPFSLRHVSVYVCGVCVCVCVCVCARALIRVRFFATPWTVAHQARSSVHGISQARILQWVAISFSRGSS